MLNSPKTRLKKVGVYASLAIAPIVLIGATALVRPQPLMAQSGAGEATFTLPTNVKKGTTVNIDGSDSMATINANLQEQFKGQFGGTEVNLEASGTNAALEALLDEKIDLAALGRQLTDQEKSQGLVEVPLAKRKIAIIVSPDNAFAEDLTIEQFGQIFRGEVTDWSELGGTAGPIRFVDRPDTSDTRQAFQNYPVFQAAPFQTGATADPVAEDRTDAVVDALGNDGIGYALVDQVQDRSDVRILSMHQVLPTDQRYPFSQPLGYAYKGPEANPAVQAFLGYATAPDNKALLEPGALATVGVIDGAVQPGDTAGETGNAETAADATGETSADSAEGSADGTADGAARVEATTDADTANQGTIDRTAQTETRTGGDADRTAAAGGFRWWPLLLLPLLAGGLWWLLGRGKEGAGAGSALAGAAGTERSRLILAPRDCKTAYAYWELSGRDQRRLNASPRRALSLRLYEEGVEQRGSARASRRLIQTVDCSAHAQDQHFSIPNDNRDYFVELGYESNGHWTVIESSDIVRVPACAVSQGRPTTTTGATTGLAPHSGSTSWQPATAKEGVIPKKGGSTPKGTNSPYRRGTVNPRGDVMPGKGMTSPDGSTGGSLGGGGTTMPRNKLSVGDGVNGAKGNLAKGAAAAGAAAAGATAWATQRPRREPATRTSINEVTPETARVTERERRAVGKANPDQIILVPHSQRDGYVYWEVDDSTKQELRKLGGRDLKLRIHDVTKIDMDRTPPHDTWEYDCSDASVDMHVTLPTTDRDYIAELGYTTADGRWLRLTRSLSVSV